jgi:hypothetical protein
MTVSLPVMATLAVGDEVTVVEGPCVLTDLIVTELSGGAPACVVITGAEDAVSLITLSVLAGQTVSWHGKLVIGSGLCLTSSLGDVAVTVGYY